MSQPILHISEFQHVIPNELKPYIHVSIALIPESARSIIRAFEISLNSLLGKVRIRKDVNVIFSVDPFTLSLSNGRLIYEPASPDIINVHIEDILILLNWQKMIQYDLPFQVACILEEFVHVYMNISDEVLVSDVVALLYDGIIVRNGKYYIRP